MDSNPTTRIRIAVSNLQSGIGTTRGYWQYLFHGWKYFLPHDSKALAGAVSFLRRERIDVAAFCEANGVSRRSRGVDQVKMLADGGGLRHRAFFPTHVVGDRVNQGNAVCSRFPVRDVVNHRLPGIGEPRHLSEAEILVRGVPVRVLTTHLALDLGQRGRQIHRIAELIGKGRRRPTILAGDFNVSREEEMELLVDTKLQMATSAATFPAWNPSKRLDYLFFSSEFEIRDSHAYSATKFSDHLPLVAEVDLTLPELSNTGAGTFPEEAGGFRR